MAGHYREAQRRHPPFDGVATIAAVRDPVVRAAQLFDGERGRVRGHR
jgi:hypothetical protein